VNFVKDFDNVERFTGVMYISEGKDFFTVHLANNEREWVRKEGLMHIHEEYEEYEEEETVGEIQENL